MSTVQGGQGNIVTNGLVLNLDAANPRSYPQPYNGTTWTDLSGLGNNGTLVNGVVYTGSNGGTLVFDGVDDYAIVPENDIFNIDTGFTLSIWFNRNNSGASNARLFFKGASSTGVKGFNLQGGVSSLSFYVGDNINRTSISTPISVNIWNYITVVYKKNESFQIFRNGILINSGTPFNTDCNNTNNITIGGQGTSLPFPGNISNINWYNRILSNSEVLQNFNATRARFGI